MSPPAANMVHYAEESRRAAVGHQCADVESNREESSFCTTTTTTTKHNKIILDKKESQQSEKQILVDPVSLRESAAIMHQMMMYPVTTGPKLEVMSVPLHHLQQLPPPPPAAAAAASNSSSSSSEFMSSCSLPNSASSSLHFDLTLTKHKKKYKKHGQGMMSSLARQHSVALSNLEQLRESHLRRSKSCGEGRACQPSVDFDLWSPTNHQTDVYNHETEVVRVEEKREEGKTLKTFHKRGGPKEAESSYEDDDGKFNCGACLFLPGLGKGKAVMRARKEVEEEEEDHERGGGMTHIDVVSQRVSLEKFECGSWRSSAIMHCEEDGDPTSNLFFDLPVELIRCRSVNDTDRGVNEQGVG